MSLRRILFSVSTSHSAILVSCDFILVTSFPAAPLTSQPHRSPPPLGTQSTNRTTTSPAEATTGEIQQLLRPLLPLIIGYFVQTQIKVLNLSALTFRVHRCDHRVAYQSLSVPQRCLCTLRSAPIPSTIINLPDQLSCLPVNASALRSLDCPHIYAVN